MTDLNPVDAMTTLSPAAQAVLDAYWTLADLLDREVSHDEMLAAALRAVADQVVPVEPYYENCDVVREDILAIAAELEGAQ